MNWNQNKIIFNYIINKDYTIKKDISTNDILLIKWLQFEMKCKYFLAFNVNESNEILWSCDNPYIDQKTKYFSQYIKYNLNNEENYSSIFLNNLKKLLQTNLNIIYEEEKINLMWCLLGKYNNYKQYYIITDIIYL